MAERLRFGLIGCGQQGRWLQRALAQVTSAVLVACADPDEAAVDASATAGITRFSDCRALLEQARVDAVIIATPHHALAGTAIAAAEAGRAVFCEKPLGINTAEARLAVAAAQAAGVPLMVGYCLRYDVLRQRAKALIEAGAVGRIVCVTAGKGGVPHPGGWLADCLAGGGQLLWVGSHLIDQVLWLVEQMPTRVFAEIEWRADHRTDDTAVFTLRFAGGVLAHLDTSQAAHTTYDYLDLTGTQGRIRVDWRPHPVLTVHSNVIPEYLEPTVIRPVDYDPLAMYVAELREFAAAVQEDRPPAVTGDDGLRVLKVLDAVVASAGSESPVQV